jgi:P-type Mg2+ transporter
MDSVAALPEAEVFARLGTSVSGLSSAEATQRLKQYGRNEIADRSAGAFTVLLRQFNNPFLILLAATAALSLFLHDSSDAYIILCIVVLSVGLSFVNEYQSERAVADLRKKLQAKAVVQRDGRRASIDASELVPGDIVFLDVGDIIPADVRLIEVRDLECDESVLTGESMPAEKTAAPGPSREDGATRSCCAYSGTVVKSGSATGVVIATGPSARVGSIAGRLSRSAPRTAFEQGLRGFSMLLIRVTIVMTVLILGVNMALHRPLVESLLFALSIAIGLTPQLLPAIVTVSLSYGARLLAKRGVIVKRLVSIENLGNVQVLFTDKTGTLTEGQIRLRDVVDASGAKSAQGLLLGLLCSDVVVQDGRAVRGNAVDVALWDAAAPQDVAAASCYKTVDRLPFSYERQMMSALVDAPDGRRLLICKGASEALFPRCVDADQNLRALLMRQEAGGNRVIAVASREAPRLEHIGAADETGLTIAALLLFADQPKAGARASLDRLAQLKIELKIVTGDSQQVAMSICTQLGMPIAGVLTGAQLSDLSDDQLKEALPKTNIFARVTPEQKSRIIHLQRADGTDVGFLGDGVNDAVALHDADVGISVDSAVDVAKDAADIVLLEKDLGVLADGVMQGRRIFGNTIKYILMDTSSNFGNMFSAAGASFFLSFLPMLPSQILLNNLLYDASEMTIPTDNVDDEMLERPAHWDDAFIRRFMTFFGPISSIFDFATFAVMLFVFHAGAVLFRTGWFVESLSTQSLVIFIIRTRRAPFFKSKPSWPLTLTTLGVVAVGMALPFTRLGNFLGFQPLPGLFFAILGVMIVIYLLLIELGKLVFYRFINPNPSS